MGNGTDARYLEPTGETVNMAFDKIKAGDTGIFNADYKNVSTAETVIVPVRFSYNGQEIRTHSSFAYAGESLVTTMDEIEILGLTPIRRMLTNLVNSGKE